MFHVDLNFASELSDHDFHEAFRNLGLENLEAHLCTAQKDPVSSNFSIEDTFPITGIQPVTCRG